MPCKGGENFHMLMMNIFKTTFTLISSFVEESEVIEILMQKILLHVN